MQFPPYFMEQGFKRHAGKAYGKTSKNLLLFSADNGCYSYCSCINRVFDITWANAANSEMCG